MTEKKNRLKEIDAIQLDQDAEVEKAEWELEKKDFEEKKENLANEGENEEADPTFKSRIARLQRYYARKEKKHEERLEEIFADMKIQRESLDEEAERLSQEVENLRVFRKKLVAELESADE